MLHDLGDLVAGKPRDIELVYSQHRCTHCNRFFNADTSAYALPKSRYTHHVVALAVRLVVEDGLPYQAASWHWWRDHRVFVPFATIQNLRAVAQVRKQLAASQPLAQRGRPRPRPNVPRASVRGGKPTSWVSSHIGISSVSMI